MQDIVNDFLVLSQCSHASRMEIFDIRDAVSQAYNNVQDYPGAAKVRFTMPEDNSYPLLYGNSKLIVRTIVNLLTNAIKYISFEGKLVQDQVHISISVIDDRVAVQVDDNGRGIPAKDIEHLFERFYRVDNSGNREVGGSGIGLAIAKEIADMHDGVISVTSTFGQGATFILSLPTGKTVFDAAYNDAKTGIISDKPLHRAAAYFLGLQECEAVRSLGYKDLESLVDEYEIIGLNLKSQLNQGFRGLVLFLLTLKIADKAIHRRQYAQNRNLSAERGAASMCSASTRHTLPTYISFRRSTELSARVDLHRLPLRHSTHVPVARAA